MNGLHTLVVPTHNRPALIRRLVRYYRLHARDLNLLVLDSSRPEVSAENANALSSCGDSLCHVIFPTTEPFVSKLINGLDLVQTRYLSFCGDDDLVFPAELARAISFLESHRDYVAAHGLYLGFREDGSNLYVTREYSGPGNEAEHPGARIFQLLQRYESLFFAVFRTPDLKDVLCVLPAFQITLYQELFQAVAALIKGKVRRFARIYAARQTCPPADPTRDKWQTQHWFADNPAEVIENYRPYCEEVWKFYEKHALPPKLDKYAFIKTLDLAHSVYFSSGCPPEYFYSVLQHQWPRDRYQRIGPLDVLGEANRLLTLKRLMLPGGSAESDLFEQLRMPQTLPRWMTSGAVGGLRFMWQSALSAPRILALNKRVAKVSPGAWKCCLPLTLRWLAGVPHFRETYLELCRYLDGT